MCPCGVVYSVKFNLRAESPKDFTDMLLSWKHFPNVTVYDYARGLASHANCRQPLDPPFHPHEGRLLHPSPKNIKLAAERKLRVDLAWLKHRKEEEDKDCHPITGSSDHYALLDVFHQCNSKDDRDLLRRIELVPELAGHINSLCAEQLFSGMRKNNYFLNMLTPSAHIFLQRDILHLYNVDRNNKVKEQFKTIVGSNTAFSLDVNGRITLGHQSKETTTPQLTLHTVKAHQSCWGQKLTQTQENMLSQVLDSRGSPDERLAYLNNQILTRTDFWTLGRPQDVEGMILNSCLKVIENLANHQVVKLHTFSNINVSPSVYNLFWTEITTVLQGIKVFLANSYVVHTWFIPSVQNPEQHLPDKADDFQWILVPVWRPGHWTICLLANLFGIIPLLVVLQFCSVQKQVALLVSPGPWREFCANDIQGIPRQRACGVFVLMYALYFVMESAFDFSELDMEHLRRWWCMLLIDNFPVTFEGRRSTKRRLEREDCEDSPRKKDPLAKTAAEILVSSEEEDGEKHPFISSAMAASQWCSAKNMGDKVILPQILSMAPLDREAALLNLGEASNLRDEDSWEDRMDPFMFRFKFESDYLMFFEQYIDKENLKVHTCFEERG
ncbi:uncharacterized protein LOC117553203 isoform X2 [Gymnodraco acuticeps]|nr:uncharacterized protein LOC117553203 isoform X2 [Gymnodraco acuticeps]XP_034082920.1 uncharacterized protein LOC117553203 isoform X2 [Gymnodraco acuticeps]